MNKEEYLEYLKSPHWQKVSAIRRNMDDNTCWICKDKGIFNYPVHHKTYERIGDENIETDLITVCPDCHHRIHDVLAKYKSKNISNKLREEYWLGLVEILEEYNEMFVKKQAEVLADAALEITAGHKNNSCMKNLVKHLESALKLSNEDVYTMHRINTIHAFTMAMKLIPVKRRERKTHT